MQKEPCNKSRCLIAYISGRAEIPIKQKELKKELKKQFKGISSLKVPSRSKFWKGYGFVKFSSRGALLDFLERSHVYLEDLNLTLTVKPHKHQEKLLNGQEEPKFKRKIRVSEVPDAWDDLILREKLESFGDIGSCFIKKVAPKFEAEGIVTFRKGQSALKCVLNKKIFYGFSGKFLKAEFHDKDYSKHVSEEYFKGDRNKEERETRNEILNKRRGKRRSETGEGGELTPDAGDRRIVFAPDQPHFITAENLAYVGKLAYKKKKESKEILKNWYKKSESDYHQLKPTKSQYYNIFPYNLMRSMSSFKNYRMNCRL